MSVPTTQKALLLTGVKEELVIKSTDTPKAGPGELLVHVESTALNPVDWKVQETGWGVEQYPVILGTDSAGVVAALGEGVAEFAVGDKIVHQGFRNIRQASFQQYTTVPAEIAAKIPPNVTFDQAASVPLGLATAVIGLYNTGVGAGFAPFWEAGGAGKYAGKPIIVFGGSSSVGQYVLQAAKHSGFSPIITTASPRNFDLVKSLGATHVVDRNLPLSTLPDQVKAITSELFTIIYDAIATSEIQLAAQGLVDSSGVVITVLGVSIPEEKRDESKKFINTRGSVHPEQNRPIGKSLYSNLTKLLETGDIKPNHVEYIPGGLGSVQAQLYRLKKGEISGHKIIVRPAETP